MKFYVRADIYNELVEKAYGKRDFSKLTRKVITDKNGHRRTVFVKNEIQPVKKTPSNSIWIEDPKRGVKIVNHGAVKNAYDILTELEEKGLGKLTDVQSKEFSFEGKDFTIESGYNNGTEHFTVELKEPDTKSPIYERMNEESDGEKYLSKHIIVNSDNKDEIKEKLIYWLTGKKGNSKENIKNTTKSYTPEEQEKNYYELIEALNGYDRTDSYEIEKYKRENERLRNAYPKEQIAKYFNFAKDKMSGSKEDIANYLKQINIKNPSNFNYLISEMVFNDVRTADVEWNESYENLADKVNIGTMSIDEMAQKLYDKIHPENKEKKEKNVDKPYSNKMKADVEDDDYIPF